MNPDDDEFDSAWEALSEEALDDDQETSKGAQAEGEGVGDVPDPEPPVDPEVSGAGGTPPEPDQDESSASAESASRQEIEELRHKIKSAEGRFSKFEEHIDGLKAQLAKREKPDEEAEPDEETLVLPEGWTRQDWEDYCADNPVQAEVLSQQQREVKALKEQVEAQGQQAAQREAKMRFVAEIEAVHPDYSELLANERQQIETFIKQQANPVLKSAYQGIYDRGTASQINAFLNEYKASKGEASQARNSRQAAVEEALAVPSKSSSPVNPSGRAGVPDENDFDGAWDYFKDEDIDS